MLLGGLLGEDGRLRSERLLLRPPRRADLVPLDDAIRETLPELVRWLPWAHGAHSRSDTRRYIRAAVAARGARAAFEFVIADPEAGTLLGMASLHRLDWPRRSAGLGYWIRRTCWGKGYATESGRLLLGHAFETLELNRVEALVAIDNTASHRVVENLHFQREGVARGIERLAGAYLDHVQYARLVGDEA